MSEAEMNGSYFSESYGDARGRFLQVAKERGIEVRHEEHPQRGPGGEHLFVDIARVGDPNASKACVIISGTHGVEGYCGSAAQTEWLTKHEQNNLREVQVFLIHALNPYGFAWSRRVTEDNVDLNRNCLEFDSGRLPRNPGYAELEPILNPRVLDENSLTTLNPELAERMRSAEKVREFKTIVGKGQYEFPKGIIYGGKQPTWSAKVLREFIGSLPGSIALGCVLDIHTGLGNSGELQILTEERSSKLERLKVWFQGSTVTSVGDPESLGYRIEGSIYQAFTTAKSDSPWYCVALEFGTRPLPEILLALQADNWLHCFAKQDTPLASRIRQLMKSAFTDSSYDWQRAVLEKSLRSMSNAIRGLETIEN